MVQTQMSGDEVARRGNAWYAESIRAKVETPENIGKMVIIDVESGDYELAESGLTAADRLYERHPQGKLFGIRVGYRAAATIGGTMERVSL